MSDDKRNSRSEHACKQFHSIIEQNWIVYCMPEALSKARSQELSVVSCSSHYAFQLLQIYWRIKQKMRLIFYHLPVLNILLKTSIKCRESMKCKFRISKVIILYLSSCGFRNWKQSSWPTNTIWFICSMKYQRDIGTCRLWWRFHSSSFSWNLLGLFQLVLCSWMIQKRRFSLN